ncbi:MAG: response regulator receiver [Anaerolineaceae bacterium]|nr:MAG: response regulator receiver [Anaerolineaceae bacterium]
MPKVLLADDDFTMVSLLKTLLGMEGYQVETLLDKTGDLMEYIRALKPDIFLVDFFLGDRNGLDLVRELRRQPDLKSIKVVMASGIDKSDECLAAGANAFLLKPYMPDDLFKILRAQRTGPNA